jgi:hypothetical protein
MKIHRLAMLASVLFLSSTIDCGSPRDAHCSNDGECEALGGNFKYCLEAHCVECVTNAACGAYHYCHHGACVTR